MKYCEKCKKWFSIEVLKCPDCRIKLKAKLDEEDVRSMVAATLLSA